MVVWNRLEKPYFINEFDCYSARFHMVGIYIVVYLILQAG